MIQNTSIFSEIFNKVELESDRLKEVGTPAVKLTRVLTLNYYEYDVLDYDELLEYEGDQFVKNLDIKLLGNKLSDSVIDNYTQRLQSGSIDKSNLICEIELSEEGIKRGVFIENIHDCELNFDYFKKLRGDIFANVVYQWILGRPAADKDVKNIEAHIKKGISREHILYSIVNSEEARKNRVKIAGLEELYKKAHFKYRIKRILRIIK